MRTVQELVERQLILQRQRKHYEEHLGVLQQRRDLHGVMDCAADLRELEAKLEELSWMLGGSMGS